MDKIMGTVHARLTQFNKIYYGEYLNTKVQIIIENDGRIRLSDAGNGGGEYGTNIANYVEMPGKIIRIKKMEGGDFTKEKLKTFKDDKGKDPSAFFQIVAD